jgi:cell division protein FtsB
MIKYFLSLTVAAATVVSCNQSPAGDKRAELEALKKDQAELKNKIAALEEDLAKNDTTKNAKLKIVSATDMAPQTFTHLSKCKLR